MWGLQPSVLCLFCTFQHLKGMHTARKWREYKVSFTINLLKVTGIQVKCIVALFCCCLPVCVSHFNVLAYWYRWHTCSWKHSCHLFSSWFELSLRNFVSDMNFQLHKIIIHIFQLFIALCVCFLIALCVCFPFIQIYTGSM